MRRIDWKLVWHDIRGHWVREEVPLAPLTDEAGNPLPPPPKIYSEEEGWAHFDLERLRTDLDRYRRASWHVGFGTGVMLASLASSLVIHHRMLVFLCAFLYAIFVPNLLRPITLAGVPVD